MKISNSFSHPMETGYNQSFKGISKNPVYIPSAIGKLGKVVGEYVNTPEQKLFLATTALMLTPLIDLKFADDEKKTDVAIKSASKAIAGGVTGVAIRAAFLNITEHFIGFDKHNKLNQHFFPDDAIKLKENSPALANIRMNQYCKTLGTLFAVIFMILFSNSKVDVPFTSDMQDLITGVVKENKSWLKSLSDVSSARKDKIKNWFVQKKNILTKLKNKTEKVIDALQDEPTAENKGDAAK